MFQEEQIVTDTLKGVRATKPSEGGCHTTSDKADPVSALGRREENTKGSLAQKCFGAVTLKGRDTLHDLCSRSFIIPLTTEAVALAQSHCLNHSATDTHLEYSLQYPSVCSSC